MKTLPFIGRYSAFYILLFCFFSISVLYGQTVVSVKRLPALDELFRRKSGWTGGDADYSICLGKGRALWLFGDSWIGDIEDGKHVKATMVNNAVAIQKGIDPQMASIEHYWSREEKARAFFSPEKDWYWPLHGIRTSKGLYVFLVNVAKTEESSVFGFKTVGSTLAFVSNADECPSNWKITYNELPFTRLTSKRELLFGASVLRCGNWIYIYGTDDMKAYGQLKRSVIVARVKEVDLEYPDKWNFWNGSSWKESFLLAKPLFYEGAKEFSVSYLPSLDKYVAIYTHRGMSPEIMARFSNQPQGPFSEAKCLYECPEMDDERSIFTYAAKAHPWLAQFDDELIITYTSNCMDFFQLAANARLYWPLFLSVRFK